MTAFQNWNPIFPGLSWPPSMIRLLYPWSLESHTQTPPLLSHIIQRCIWSPAGFWVRECIGLQGLGEWSRKPESEPAGERGTGPVTPNPLVIELSWPGSDASGTSPWRCPSGPGTRGRCHRPGHILEGGEQRTGWSQGHLSLLLSLSRC